MADKISVAVIGAGLMGHGIAQVFAVAGHPVTIYDPSAAVLEKVVGRIAANLELLGEDMAAAQRRGPQSRTQSRAHPSLWRPRRRIWR